MLVDYSSSSEEDAETENDKQAKQNCSRVCHDRNKHLETKLLPTVPSSIVNMFNNNPSHHDHKDDPSLHGGRQRSFDHERGNWATHVYIPYEPSPIFSELLIQLLECLGPQWQPVEDFHISLSQTFPIRFHWIDGLYQSLKSVINMKRFDVMFHGYKIYVNDERSRSFLGLNVSADKRQIPELIGEYKLMTAVIGQEATRYRFSSFARYLYSQLAALVDRSVSEYGLPVYYTSPELHISVCWCLGDAVRSLTEDQHRLIQDLVLATCQRLSYHAERAVMKTGHRLYNLPFS